MEQYLQIFFALIAFATKLSSATQPMSNPHFDIGFTFFNFE